MNIDQTCINLVTIISADTPLKKVAQTAGGEWHGACPFCGGVDRLSVQPNKNGGRWYCRHCQTKGGDAVAYIMRRENLAFKAALSYLGLAADSPAYRRRASLPYAPKTTVNDLKKDYAALNDPVWQAAATAFDQRCRQTLHSRHGKKALDYLLGRGLTPEIIEQRGLGYNPTEKFERWGKLRVKLAAGVVIPWQLGGQYWNIRIRRLEKGTGSKYLSPAGVANGLYCGIQPTSTLPTQVGDVVILTEGEFDAMLVQFHAQIALGTRVKAFATGSTGGARVFKWLAQLNIADRVILAFDADLAGDRAATWWHEALGEAKSERLRPTKHDINDMTLAGEDMKAWLAPVARDWQVLS